MNSEVVIAHISDLHFPHHRPETLQYLNEHLKKKSPSVILVTGDLTENPSPWQQWRLRRELDVLSECCRELKCCREGECRRNGGARRRHISVVPGNHDYALLGNVPMSPFSRSSFRTIFRDYRRRFIEITADDLNVFVFCFNSNPYVARWAKGSISRRQLKWFEKKANTLRKADKEKFDAAYKIAILHHHPLPIPFSEEMEKFLILKNAGELLRLLAQCKIDLVLHGHKHHSVISSLNMGTSYGATRKLFVVASGTTLRKGDGKNTCNIITIRRRGQAEVTPVEAQPGQEFVDKEPVLLPSWEDYIRGQYEFQRARLGYEIKEFVKEVVIDDEGDSDTTTKIDGVCITHPDNFAEKRKEANVFRLQTESGRLVSEIESGSSSLALKPKTVKTTDLTIEGTWELPDRMHARESHSAWIRYLTLNAWAMNTEEFERKYSPYLGVKQEEEWFTCERPIRLFRQVIYFPKGWKPEGEPSLRIYSSANGKKTFKMPEVGLEKHLADALSYDDKSNTLTLTLKKPLYDFRYVVGWYLPQPPADPDPDPDLISNQWRVEELLKRIHNSPETLDDFMKALTEVVYSKLVEVIANGLDDAGKERMKDELKGEPVDISIAIPSLEPGGGRHLLEIVAYNLDLEGIKGFKFPVGEGVAGRAYKLNGVRTYLRPPGVKRLVKGHFIYNPFFKGNDHWVIYSVPLRHPKHSDLLIGVLTVGSRKSISRLLPTGVNPLEKLSKPIIDIAAGYVVKRLSDLYGSILDI